jgi:hypothetical protein
MIWEFSFDDGRKVIVHHLITGTARASLLNSYCSMTLDDSW